MLNARTSKFDYPCTKQTLTHKHKHLLSYSFLYKYFLNILINNQYIQWIWFSNCNKMVNSNVVTIVWKTKCISFCWFKNYLNWTCHSNSVCNSYLLLKFLIFEYQQYNHLLYMYIECQINSVIRQFNLILEWIIKFTIFSAFRICLNRFNWLCYCYFIISFTNQYINNWIKSK